MTPVQSISPLSRTYPTARVRGQFITRWEEQPLGVAILDASAAEVMGREHLGWFVGNHPRLARAADNLGRLDTNTEGGVWVVVPLGRELACELFALWPHTDQVTEPPTLGNTAWRSRKVWVAMPEDLNQLLPLARTVTSGVAGVIVLDPPCIMYRARGGTDEWGNTFQNDRPQHVVNFRAALDADGWQPPLLLLTAKPARSVNTETVARAFCLNGFRFVAGDSFGCWDVPIEQDTSQQHLTQSCQEQMSE